MMARKILTPNQRGFLGCLVEFGAFPNEGFTWGSASKGAMIAEALRSKGFVYRDCGKYRPTIAGTEAMKRSA